jgi:hypothetical protein
VKASRVVRLEQHVAAVEDVVTQGEPLGFSCQNIDTTEVSIWLPVITATLSMVRRDAARMGRLVLAVAAAMANASILDILPAPERISAVVCALISYPYRALTADSPFIQLAIGSTCYRDSAKNPQCSLSSTSTIPNATTIRTATSTSPRSTKTPATTSSSSRPGPSGFPSVSSQSNGAAGWKGASGLFGLAPLLVLIGMCIW